MESIEASFPPELESVVAARRLVQTAASRWQLSDWVAADAALAASELATNAVLHARTSIHVAARRQGSGMRLEVTDASPGTLIAHPENLLNNRSMTGRGLAVLSAIVDAWGVDPSESGKTIWVEVGTGPAGMPARKPAVLAAAVLDPGRRPTEHPAARAAGGRTVHFRGVPVRLLVESSRHFADLKREMQVLALDRNGPAKLLALAETGRQISAEIGALRQASSDVAEAALGRDEQVVDFDVVVPDDVLVAFSRLESLIRRSGRELIRRHVLTSVPSEEVDAYRRWYRDEVARQLAGGPPMDCPFAPPME